MELSLLKSLTLKILLVVSIIGLGFVFVARAYTNLTANTQSTSFSSISWTNASGSNTTSTNLAFTTATGTTLNVNTSVIGVLNAGTVTTTALGIPAGGIIRTTIDGGLTIGESTRQAGIIWSQLLDSDEANIGALNLSSVVYPGGTTGGQTPDTQAFRVNFAAGMASMQVTTTVAFADSIPTCTVNTNDATMGYVIAIPAAGYVTLIAKPAVPTGETAVSCVLNY